MCLLESRSARSTKNTSDDVAPDVYCDAWRPGGVWHEEEPSFIDSNLEHLIVGLPVMTKFPQYRRRHTSYEPVRTPMPLRILLVGLATVVMALATPQPREMKAAQSTRTIPFVIIDEDQVKSGQPAVDFVAGELQLTPEGGRALITSRLIRGGRNEQAEKIAVGFAYGNRFTNDWHTRRKGKQVSLGRLSSSPVDTLRDTLVVEIPRYADLKLTEHWLFFEIWGRVRPPEAGRWMPAFRSLHSRPDIFVEP